MRYRRRKSRGAKKSSPTSEYAEQCLVMEWSEWNLKNYPELEFLYATMNGVRVRVGTAIKMKKMGMKKGVPDLVLPAARGKYHGLYVEMKIEKGGVVSEHQKKWQEFLLKEGYSAVVARGAVEAFRLIKQYLDGGKFCEQRQPENADRKSAERLHMHVRSETGQKARAQRISHGRRSGRRASP